MKVKLLATTLVLILLCGMASAQGYDIRTTSRNNLRAAPSLDGAFLETVPEGTVLHVIGSLGSWLKINRNGNEVWMADWLGYSRVESSAGAAAPQPASNLPAQIDNCCFVDRQCNTAADWDNGYWAYQNGQCAAPAPAQSQTYTQSVSNVSGQIDNCCFVDRQCNTAADWEDGFYAFQNNQCPAPTGSRQGEAISSQVPSPAAIQLSTRYMTEGVRRLLANPTVDPFNNCCHMRYQDKDCSGDHEWNAGYYAYQNHQCIRPAPLWTGPAIVGSAKFKNLVETALGLIATHAPEWLRYINLSGAREFRETPNVGGFINREWSIWHGWLDYVHENPSWEPDLNYIAGYAGGIAHEACHAIQQRTYSQSPGWTNEAACVEAQLAVIEAIAPNSPDIPWLRDLVANIQNPEVWWWD